MKSIITVLFSLCLVLFAGCSTTSGLSPQSSYSGFDDSTVVSIAPHGNAPSGPMNMIGTGIGAQWNKAHGKQVILVIAVMNQRTAITGAELNIDGEKIALVPASGVTDRNAAGEIMQMSTRDFVSDIDIVEKLAFSKRTWLRVHTPTGSIENAVIDGGKDSKAFHALRRFLFRVQAS